MPYFSIKSYPRDDEQKRVMVERVTEVIQELWGCPQESITISLEEIAPEDWEEKVTHALVEPAMDNVMVLSGKKLGIMDQK